MNLRSISWTALVAVLLSSAAAQALPNGPCPFPVPNPSGTTEPETLLLLTPGPRSTSDSATFTICSNTAGAAYECSLDGAPFTDCRGSVVTYPGLSQGAHTFTARAWVNDQNGNRLTDQTPATFNWEVDSIAPDTTITSAPSGTIDASATVTVEFTSDDSGATFQCRLDDGGWYPCTSPVDATVPTEGRHDFMVQAVDSFGNIDPSPATASWAIDNGPPDTEIVGSPGSPSTTSVTFLFNSADRGATFECSLDGSAFAACASPMDLWGLADGSHTFEVRATDVVGNVDLTPASYTWSVDASPPVITITSGPAHESYVGASVVFAFEVDDPNAHVDCVYDSDVIDPCTSPYAIDTVAEGTHTFTVRATDEIGNFAAELREFTRDTTPPETTLGNVPNRTNQATVTFELLSDENATFECSTDGVQFSACATPATLPAPATDGSYTYYFRAIDGAGNVDETPASHTFIVDRTPPDITVTTKPSGFVHETETALVFSSTDPEATFVCVFDGAFTNPCTSPFTLSGYALGTHSFEVFAVDLTNNNSLHVTGEFTYSIDDDNDGLTNNEEAELGTDPLNPDTDGDGLTDGVEVKIAKTNPKDDDTDDDGLKDGTEDANGNGKVDAGETDPKKADTDEDGLTDGQELGLTKPEGKDTDAAKFKKDLDPTTKTDPTLADSDGGGVFDGNEDTNHNGKVDVGETNPNAMSDDKDADHDGLSNEQEKLLGSDPFDADSDDDGVLDGYEWTRDTDGDGTPDVMDLDSDNDGIPDGVEAGKTASNVGPGTNTSSPDFVADEDPTTTTDRRNPDTDGDGLLDGEEDSNHNGRVDEGETDPNKADTDGDGMNDKAEIDAGRNPLDPSDGAPAPTTSTDKGGCSTTGANAGMIWAMSALVMHLRRRRSE